MKRDHRRFTGAEPGGRGDHGLLGEPLFTTKPAGEGSGFGLATVFGIVGQSGGEIQLDSQPGYGTVVEVTLPASGGQVEVPRPPLATPSPPGEEVILLVEDQSAVRELTRRLLSRRGYEVLVADSPRDARRIFSSRQYPIGPAAD